MLSRPYDRSAFWSGLIFVVVGLAFLVLGAGYPMGTGRSMGPGFFPRVLSVALVLLGTIILVSSRKTKPVALPPVNWRGLVLVSVAALAFAILVGPAGMVPAVFVAVLLSSVAAPGMSPARAALLGAVLAVFCALIFVKGLGLPIAIFPLVGL